LNIQDIEDSIAAGRADAALIPWAGSGPDLFGRYKPYTPDTSIEDMKDRLRVHGGWKWNEANRQLERDGWKIWFRSQGMLSPPIAQWSRITEVQR